MKEVVSSSGVSIAQNYVALCGRVISVAAPRGDKRGSVAADHQKLKVFGDRSVDNISNTRMRNLKEKTLQYRFKMIHI